jgi:hypothetical protein
VRGALNVRKQSIYLGDDLRVDRNPVGDITQPLRGPLDVHFFRGSNVINRPRFAAFNEAVNMAILAGDDRKYSSAVISLAEAFLLAARFFAAGLRAPLARGASGCAQIPNMLMISLAYRLGDEIASVPALRI